MSDLLSRVQRKLRIWVKYESRKYYDKLIWFLRGKDHPNHSQDAADKFLEMMDNVYRSRPMVLTEETAKLLAKVEMDEAVRDGDTISVKWTVTFEGDSSDISEVAVALPGQDEDEMPVVAYTPFIHGPDKYFCRVCGARLKPCNIPNDKNQFYCPNCQQVIVIEPC